MMGGSGEADTATADEGVFSHAQVNLLLSNPDSVKCQRTHRHWIIHLAMKVFM